ncbi:MAG: hypothetical protein FE048_02235 [Thermoplasmata archaeon]|nr:MAG: hypothetical protein FE048_02235 [Thermoplasmata archaeon]
MDFTTLTILAILSFILAWFGIMIFTTNPKEEEESNMEAEETESEEEEVKKIARIAEEEHNMELEKYRDLVEKYSNMILQLRQKIETLENPQGVSNEKLLDWIAELRNENSLLRARVAALEEGKIGELYGRSKEHSELYYENTRLREELEQHKGKIAKLEEEIEELKNDLNYYRDIVNKLQGSYTVINKYNYRMCIRDSETGEYHYELVKLPPDFDPFNPTYISKDGMEIYERYGIKIPTKLGDIIREEFRKEIEYWGDDTGIDWELER